MDIYSLAIEWVIIFFLNVIPAFAPPTWAVLAYFYITTSQNILALVLVGVTASTAGRIILAKLAKIVSEKFESKKEKQEMHWLKKTLKEKHFKKMIVSFIFALGPLPSNVLFIIAGTIGTGLKDIVIGFAAGRAISYFVLVLVSQELYASAKKTLFGVGTTIDLFIELLSVIVIILFFVVDWKKIILHFEKSSAKKKSALKRNKFN